MFLKKKNYLQHHPSLFFFAKKSLLVSSASAVLSSSFGSGAILDCLGNQRVSVSFLHLESPRLKSLATEPRHEDSTAGRKTCAVLEVLVKKKNDMWKNLRVFLKGTQFLGRTQRPSWITFWCDSMTRIDGKDADMITKFHYHDHRQTYSSIALARNASRHACTDKQERCGACGFLHRNARLHKGLKVGKPNLPNQTGGR